MMTKLTLIRHAPTLANADGTFMGRLDLGITAEGMRAASDLGAALKGVEFSSHYSSPLLRARQTTKCIFPQAEIVYDENLTERDLGEWAGKTKDEIRRQHPSAFYSSGTMNPYFTPPGGETLWQVVHRADCFLRVIRLLGDNNHAVAVTHNGTIRLFRCIIEFRPLSEIFSEREANLKPRTYELSSGHWQSIEKYISDLSSSMKPAFDK